MNLDLGTSPERICVALRLSADAARLLGAAPASVRDRHKLETIIQDAFFKSGANAYVCVQDSNGGVSNGHLTILTPAPATALKILLETFRAFPSLKPNAPPAQTAFRFDAVDLLPHVHIGLLDREINFWRTFHPITLVPFWTVFQGPETLNEIIERGKMLRASADMASQ